MNRNTTTTIGIARALKAAADEGVVTSKLLSDLVDGLSNAQTELEFAAVEPGLDYRKSKTLLDRARLLGSLYDALVEAGL